MENKTGKYFKYVIGEIILVVIGILIALQINNWNEIRKDRKFELKMLTELRRALMSDLEHSQRLTKRVNKAETASYNMLENVYNNVIYNDTMWRDVNNLIIGIQYQQTLGPYEAIKSVGLDKISNDSLRNHLITFYDFSYPRQKELILWYDELYEKNYKEIDGFKGPTEIYKMGNDSLDYRERFNPSIFQNPNFLEYLTSVERWSRNTFEVLNYIQPEMKELIHEIESEINK
ncbi:DUF6090 family protein [Winogradskyella sp. A3E31]|uniref:DUF6090 family protein n=1 Tax=Winogradskyella sp. A3E31 TaxID=3349637 RepID=UPI00398A88C4